MSDKSPMERVQEPHCAVCVGMHTGDYIQGTIEHPAPAIEGPPSQEEVERVESWAICSECGGSLKMLCPSCPQPLPTPAPSAPEQGFEEWWTNSEMIGWTGVEYKVAKLAWIAALRGKEGR